MNSSRRPTSTGSEPRASGPEQPVSCHNVWTLIWLTPSWILIGLVKLYQLLLSPILGRWCRFTPSCSNYFIQAVRKYGACRGALRGVLRICRCHPLHPGGHDPP